MFAGSSNYCVPLPTYPSTTCPPPPHIYILLKLGAICSCPYLYSDLVRLSAHIYILGRRVYQRTALARGRMGQEGVMSSGG